jgi:hypothetical protein
VPVREFATAAFEGKPGIHHLEIGAFGRTSTTSARTAINPLPVRRGSRWSPEETNERRHDSA